MAILKFKSFEDAETLERQGKGVKWRFKPDNAYRNKALRFHVRVPFPAGIYKFGSFEEAEMWEREWWIKSGTAKKTAKVMQGA